MLIFSDQCYRIINNYFKIVNLSTVQCNESIFMVSAFSGPIYGVKGHGLETLQSLGRRFNLMRICKTKAVYKQCFSRENYKEGVPVVDEKLFRYFSRYKNISWKIFLQLCEASL